MSDAFAAGLPTADSDWTRFRAFQIGRVAVFRMSATCHETPREAALEPR